MEVLSDFGFPGTLAVRRWCGSAASPGVFDVFEVPDSPWLVGDLGANSFSASDCAFVVPQSFSFSRKRRAFHMESQGNKKTIWAEMITEMRGADFNWFFELIQSVIKTVEEINSLAGYFFF